MGEAGAPKALASQFAPLKAACSCASVASVTLESAPVRWVMKMIGAAPTEVVVAAGIVVLVNGSFPLMLNARTWAVDVLPGDALRISVPSRCARSAPKTGQTPDALTPYPRPARPSEPPPRVEFARHCANNPSSGRMSVAAAVTNKFPVVNRLATFAGSAESTELSPKRLAAIRLPGAGTALMFTKQWG